MSDNESNVGMRHAVVSRRPAHLRTRHSDCWWQRGGGHSLTTALVPAGSAAADDEDTAASGGGFSRSAGLPLPPGLAYCTWLLVRQRHEAAVAMHLVLGSYDGSLVGLQVAAAQVCESVQLLLAPLHARH